MESKKNTATAGGLPALKIGGRVRRNDDHAEGRIVWANGVSVKITWDDGEQVAWRRDSLAGRLIEILADDDDQPAPAAPEPTEPAAPETPPAAPEAAQEPLAAAASGAAPTTAATPPAAAKAALAPEPPIPAPDATVGPPVPASEPTQTAGKPKRRRKAPAEPREKKLSALDAAARILAETGAPMNCKELIGAMAGKGYWMSPGGKTPSATLYTAIAREIAMKGDLARFTKAGPGRFGPPRA